MTTTLPSVLNEYERRQYHAFRSDAVKFILSSVRDAAKGYAALIKIRDLKLYREDFETWEDFCESTLGVSRSYFHRLLEYQEIKLLPIGNKIKNEAQARAVKKIPESRREQVIIDVEESGKEMTAKNLEEAASRFTDPPNENVANWQQNGKSHVEPEPLGKDKMGCPIPAKKQELWDNGEPLVESILKNISDARSALRRVHEMNNVLFRRFNTSTTIAQLDGVFADLKAVIPFALCPYCQGQTGDACMECKGIGFFSKYHWGFIPEEIRNIRAQFIQDQKGQ